MRGYEAIPTLVRRHGTSKVFAMIGGTNVAWLTYGLHSKQLDAVVRTRHESTAVSAAVGYAKLTGGIGVCSVTRGPGFSNALHALIAARRHRAPIILVIAESPSLRTYTDQNVNQQGLAEVEDIDFFHVTHASDLTHAYTTVARRARQGRPQILSIGEDVPDETLELGPPQAANLNNRPMRPSPEVVRAAVDAIEEAQQPVILAGQGCVISNCRQDLERLANLTGSWLTTSLFANRFFSGHPRDLGILGNWSSPLVRDAVGACDLLIGFGASLNPRTTAGGASGHVLDGTTIIHCENDIEQPIVASSPELALLGDAATTARALTDEWVRRGLNRRLHRPPLVTIDEARKDLLSRELGHDCRRGLDLRDVLVAVDARLPKDRIVVSDNGRHLPAVVSLVDAQDSQSWHVTLGHGSIGLGLGNAIGASAASDARTVGLVVGDGGLMMMAQELDAIRLNGLKLVVILLNDEQYGAEIRHAQKHDLPQDLVAATMPDIAVLSRAFGGSSQTIRTAEELASFQFTEDRLQILDFRIDPDIDVRAAL